MVTIEIPVKNYVKAYLESHYKKNIIPLKLNDAIGKYFYSLLKHGASHRNLKQKYKSSCVFSINEDVFIRKGFFLDDSGIIQFNTFIEDLLKRELYAIIGVMLVTKNMEIKKAIRFACDKMKIDENAMPYETVKKAFYRYRKKLGNELLICPD